MVMDDEGVTRTTKWPKGLEVAGEVKWREVCDSLAQLAIRKHCMKACGKTLPDSWLCPICLTLMAFPKPQ
jgi:hypothetical protein